ncbi:hypothetical protein [Xanthomonas euroxanthea]|uniref:hypothetical protein n=1 Tax=Xanthomonas euroxanthea TaxID=2259622 RepID=UPI001608F10E|nr:hypothetical protein [Xanthomonas euroxanthea]MBB5766448.1 hypothetical protein [Xanthomonas euroxanthea]
MADIHIKSESQSGGITAQNVSYGQPPDGNKPPSRAKAIFWWVVGIASIVGAVAGVLQVLE